MFDSNEIHSDVLMRWFYEKKIKKKSHTNNHPFIMIEIISSIHKQTARYAYVKYNVLVIDTHALVDDELWYFHIYSFWILFVFKIARFNWNWTRVHPHCTIALYVIFFFYTFRVCVSLSSRNLYSKIAIFLYAYMIVVRRWKKPRFHQSVLYKKKNVINIFWKTNLQCLW